MHQTYRIVHRNWGCSQRMTLSKSRGMLWFVRKPCNCVYVCSPIAFARSVRNTLTCIWDASKLMKQNWLVEVVGCMRDWPGSMNWHSWSRMIEGGCVEKHSIMLCTKFLCTTPPAYKTRSETKIQKAEPYNNIVNYELSNSDCVMGTNIFLFKQSYNSIYKKYKQSLIWCLFVTGATFKPQMLYRSCSC